MTGWLMVALLAQPPQPPSFEPVFREAVAQRLKQYGGRHQKYAESLVNLALFLEKQNPQSAEPERLLRQALSIAPAGTVKSAEINEHLGATVAAKGRDAAPFYERALAIRDKQTPSETEPLLTKLGDLRSEAGKHSEAEMLYRRAIAILEKGDNPERMANACNNLAVTLEAQDRAAEAEPFYRRAAELYSRALGPRHPEVGSVLVNLAGAVRSRGDLDGAEALLKRALAILESTVGARHPRLADAYESLAVVLQAKGDGDAARRYQQRADSIRKP